MPNEPGLKLLMSYYPTHQGYGVTIKPKNIKTEWKKRKNRKRMNVDKDIYVTYLF